MSLQLSSETRRQIRELADHWGLPKQRHNTPVIERAVATLYMLEIGYDTYRSRLDEMMAGES